jgi:hypothetical protein
MLAAEWGVGQVLWAFLWFFLFFIWIWLLISVLADVFRSHDLRGWAKALWVVFILVLPYLGVLVYLIARGNKMSQHAIEDAKARDEAFRAYVREAAGSGGGPGVAEELARLADLRERGVIDTDEFARLKAKLVG